MHVITLKLNQITSQVPSKVIFCGIKQTLNVTYGESDLTRNNLMDLDRN